MKKLFITALFVGLFVSVSAVWASGDDQKDKSQTTTTAVAKPVVTQGTTKACCSTDKSANCAKAGDAKACCAATKDNGTAASDTKACCAAKKGDNATAAANVTKPCCVNKTSDKSAIAAAACTNKGATADAKSSGKKVN